MNKTYITLLLGMLIGAVLSGLGVYYVTEQQANSRHALFGAVREDITNYRYIDPLLLCNTPEATTGVYKELDEKLASAINDEKSKGNASAISLYFQEYPSGRWVGIDENHAYDPASLLKIVLMISYFKDEELHPGTLSKTYRYTKTIEQVNQEIPFGSTTELVVGRSYSAEELIEAMIINSDNGAKDILLSNANQDTLDAVYKDLKVEGPTDTGNYTISPKAYSEFFRILYNATYLSRALSEKAMQILAKVNYDDGLVAGLPKDTTVAHKYGEHVSVSPDGSISSVELHDCGVVYGPNLPYFICIMTTGDTISGLQTSIKDLSRTVFQSLDTKIQK